MRRWIYSLGWFVLTAALVSGLAGCGKKKPPAPPAPAPRATPPPLPPPPPPPPPPAPAPAPSEADLFRRASIAELQGSVGDIYYEYDKSELLSAARDTLVKNADWLKKSYNTAVIQIEGHCDERGTNEYNLALGERRAKAAMDYLVSLGVPAARLNMISYGKERPQCTESSESCWQRNRRAHFLITSK